VSNFICNSGVLANVTGHSGDWNTKKLTSKAFAPKDSLSLIFRMRRRRLAREATWAAMKSGAQAIVQAALESGDWRGRADVLLRVEQIEKASYLGNWSYEVVDCKLARETKAETILQLCLYSGLVTELQGLEPELFHVIRSERWLRT